MTVSRPPVFAAFDRIRIVNLAHRTDRRREMEEQLALVGLRDDPRVEFFPALSFDDPAPFRRAGSRGNFESRVILFREAASANESLLVLEDDCDFVLPDILTYELPERWDVFYGGYTLSNGDDPSTGEIQGSHFMGFSRWAVEAAAQYLSDYLKPDFEVDPIAARVPGFDPAVRPPIDGAFVWFRRAHPDLATVFARLGVQRSSRTDVGDQKWFDRVPVLRDAAGQLRRVRRKLVHTG
jgi:hypothetical protein